MGPLSGIGDAVFLTTIRVVAAGIAISLASQGNVLGPIIFLLLFNVPQYFLRVWGIHKGYEIGVSLLETAEQSGIMDKVIKAAGIIGMMVVGSMTCGMFWASLAVEFGSGEEVTTLQSVLDGIMPGLLGLKTGRHIIFHTISESGDVTIIRILHERMDVRQRFR